MKKIKCVYCDEVINDNEPKTILYKKGASAHFFCQLKAKENSSSRCYVFFPEDKANENHIYSFDEFFCECEGRSYSKLPVAVKKQIWVKTKGPNGELGGYTDWELNPEYKEFTDGWFTDCPDSTTKRKVELSQFFNALIRQNYRPPVTVQILFGMTSSKFSKSVSVVVRKDDEEAFEEFLKEIGWSKEKLEECLE